MKHWLRKLRFQEENSDLDYFDGTSSYVKGENYDGHESSWITNYIISQPMKYILSCGCIIKSNLMSQLWWNFYLCQGWKLRWPWIILKIPKCEENADNGLSQLLTVNLWTCQMPHLRIEVVYNSESHQQWWTLSVWCQTSSQSMVIVTTQHESEDCGHLVTDRWLYNATLTLFV